MCRRCSFAFMRFLLNFWWLIWSLINVLPCRMAATVVVRCSNSSGVAIAAPCAPAPRTHTSKRALYGSLGICTRHSKQFNATINIVVIVVVLIWLLLLCYFYDYSSLSPPPSLPLSAVKRSQIEWHGREGTYSLSAVEHSNNQPSNDRSLSGWAL